MSAKYTTFQKNEAQSDFFQHLREKNATMTDQTFTINDTVGSFGGKLLKLSHNSKSNGCVMNVNVYFPPQAESGPVPVLFFLAGLTSTQDNCAEKGFLQPSAAKHGIAVVYPDTSPRKQTRLFTRQSVWFTSPADR